MDVWRSFLFWPRSGLTRIQVRELNSDLIKGALCAQVIWLRVSSNQNDETRSRNSLMYMSKASLPIAKGSP